MVRGVEAEFIQTTAGERVLVTRFTRDETQAGKSGLGLTLNTEYVALTRDEARDLITRLLYLLTESGTNSVTSTGLPNWVPPTSPFPPAIRVVGDGNVEIVEE